MLCPEVWNFPAPKVITKTKRTDDLEVVKKTIRMNSFYRSVIISCPDELNVPNNLKEVILDDTEYYKILDCSLTEFIDVNFVDNFVKNGQLYCLSVGNNCIVDNCACITPDGILTIHLIEYVFQTLGLEGTKRPHNYYEVKIDLKNLNNVEKLRNCLSRLQKFNFYVTWEPVDDKICPSSLAKYFCDRNIDVQLEVTKVKMISPDIPEIPTLLDTEPFELVEWVGMLAHDADLSSNEEYINSYCPPESDTPMKSTRIALLIAEGFFTTTVLEKLCLLLTESAELREIENYWNCLSIQSFEDSLWQWTQGSPNMFQAHDSSTNILFTRKGQIMHTVGQLKYS